MSASPTLSCPTCKRSFGALDWLDANECRCNYCREDFRFYPFPALTRAADVAKPQSVTVAEDSTCFFHAENQAEKVCDGCGRFLCAVCSVPFAGQTMCPTCISTKKRVDEKAVVERTLYDGIALSLAVFPIFMWPITLVTAPATLCIVIVNWRKPRSLVQPGRVKLIIAGVIALLQVCGWAFLGLNLWLG